MQVDYRTTNVLTRHTFESKPIRDWVEQRLVGRVLNACSGPTKLDHDGEIVRNDYAPDVESDLSVDVAHLAAELSESSFDTVLFDPPWSLYQSNMRYDGRGVRATGENLNSWIGLDDLPLELPSDKSQIGHARLAKDGFDYLLRPGGRVIQLTMHGTCMPDRLGYDRVERVMFDPLGEAKTVIGSIDRKPEEDDA